MGTQISTDDSRVVLEHFHAWCRAVVDLSAVLGELPSFIFADRCDQPQPLAAPWVMEATVPTLETFIIDVLTSWADTTDASVLGISVPVGGDEPFVLLVTLDEAGILASYTFADLEDEERVTLEEWDVVEPFELDLRRPPADARWKRRLPRLRQVALRAVRERVLWRSRRGAVAL